MTVSAAFDVAGRRRSPATMPGYHAGRAPRNKGQLYPADPPTVEEIIAVMRETADDRHGARLRALIVVLWRSGLRVQEALALGERDLDPRRGSLLVRSGKGGRRREIGMDPWGWEQLRPWLDARVELPVGPLFCIIDGPTRGRSWSTAGVRVEFRRLAAAAGVRRRFAPHQLRHAHAVELAREGVPLNVIQRQLGHANLGTTSIYLQGIDTEEIIATVHARRAPMMSATAGLRLWSTRPRTAGALPTLPLDASCWGTAFEVQCERHEESTTPAARARTSSAAGVSALAIDTSAYRPVATLSAPATPATSGRSFSTPSPAAMSGRSRDFAPDEAPRPSSARRRLASGGQRIGRVFRVSEARRREAGPVESLCQSGRVHVRARKATLALAEPFTIARASRRVQEVVRVELEHEGVVGLGEATPVYYWGETVESALGFLSAEVSAALGDDPFALEAIGRRLAARPGEQAAKCALDAALHDWIGKRVGQPVWRLLGLAPTGPPTSYTIGIDTVEGTADRARRACGFPILKVKVGGPDDLARLEAVRRESAARIRVDGNEGWTLESARELMPALIELGVELVEQPFPAEDVESFRALRELSTRLPVLVDEGCRDLASVAPIAAYADGINVKLAKAGGLREAVRMIHAARALRLRVMLGCMIESELGIAAAAQIACLADDVDLDGHLLIVDPPFAGLGFTAGRVTPSSHPGLGVRPAR